MNNKLESEHPQNKPKLHTLLDSIKHAYRQYKLDLNYVKNISNFWKGKPYRFGLTHLSIVKHRLKHFA